MSRRPRLCPPNIPQHVVQRGNDRQVCFTCDDDRKAYANWLYEGSEKHQVHVHAQALHYHCTIIALSQTIDEAGQMPLFSAP